MPRSPSDATRFTATGPYAASGTSFGSNVSNSPTAPSGSQIAFGSPASENETPQQKIARLRAAAAAAKRGHESQFDKVVRVGRFWADRAHRVTAIGLIGLTVLSAVVATAGVGDMLVHNRRRRKEWLAEQRAKTSRDVAEARDALERGEATEDQILYLNRERVVFEVEEARRNKPGMFKRMKNMVVGESATAKDTLSASETFQSSNDTLLGGSENKGVLEAVTERVEANRRSGEQVEEAIRPFGGPLDRQAQRAANGLSDTSRSWTSWITGR